jgi:RecA-family ATPase
MTQVSELVLRYADVSSTPVRWLWFPYIPQGKITLLQGDPGDGKSTMMLNLIAALSSGTSLPDGTPLSRQHRVIYQCSEDDAADTIKPRLEGFGAECRNIAFIKEEMNTSLTLDDERIRLAIAEFKPTLVVIDPIQAYIGSDSDLQIAARARKLMRRIGLWASSYDCAIVLIGHMNKKEGGKDLYRGLGSIDIVAAARSVLSVEREPLEPHIREVHQIKNSLAPVGETIYFEICPETGFHWGKTDNPPLTERKTEIVIKQPKNKHELAAEIIQRELADGDIESKKIQAELTEYGIGEKTVQEVKASLGVKSYMRMRKWYWSMNSADGGNQGHE